MYSQAIPRRVGLPRMHAEAGERRDFLPTLVHHLDRLGATEILLEEGYGAGVGSDAEAYRSASARVRFGSREECLAQELVIVLRCPPEEVLETLRPGTVLLSMLHYGTRPERVARLARCGVRAVSLDELVDDEGRRLVENLRAVGWNGMREAFRVLDAALDGLHALEERPVRVLLLGAGAVATHAMQAAVRYGDPERAAALAADGAPGVVVLVADAQATAHERFVRAELGRADLVADATRRPDASRPVIPNAWFADLPPHAVLLDLSVDPYALDADPPTVKGLEGVPGGNLDRWVFPPDDPAWDALDPRIPTAERRTALSCYAWPGLTPRECMERYGAQIEPVLRVLLSRPLHEIDERAADPAERAVARAELERWRARRGEPS